MSVHILRIRQAGVAGGAYLTQAAKMSFLNVMTTGDSPWVAMKAGLFIAPSDPNPDTEYADFDPPAWTGYVAKDVTNNPVTPLGQFGAVMECVSVDWQSHPDADTLVLGAILANTDLDSVIGYGLFDEPLPVAGEQTITVVFTFDVE